jgi:hypothetical protein
LIAQLLKGALSGIGPDNACYWKIYGKNLDKPFEKSIIRKKFNEYIVNR